MPRAIDTVVWDPNRRKAAAFKTKQPSEEYFIAFDFTPALVASADTITSYTIAAIDTADQSDVVATITDAVKAAKDTMKVYCWVRSGTTGKTYQFTCKIVGTPNGIKCELDATMKVTAI